MLETVWFLLWGILWAIYFLLDGFDLGLGTLLPFIGRNEQEKHMIHAAIGPYWDGNEVWLITVGGVTFAAFPGTYAVLFSAFYTPLMFILFALIVRAAAFEFRDLRIETSWRSFWDAMAAIGSFLPAFLFGVAFANIFKGIPIDTDGVFKGTMLTFLNPYGLAGGLFFLFFFLLHGTLWLAVKTGGELHASAVALSKKLWLIFLIFTTIFIVMTAFYTGFYFNYMMMPFLFLIPAGMVLTLFAVRFYISRASFTKAWWASSITIIVALLSGIIGLYPDMLPSSINPAFSINIFNSASSPLTLKIVLVVALIFLPVVIIYQSWAYRLFRGKITNNETGYN